MSGDVPAVHRPLVLQSYQSTHYHQHLAAGGAGDLPSLGLAVPDMAGGSPQFLSGLRYVEIQARRDLTLG
jgi:hypothetical protein